MKRFNSIARCSVVVLSVFVLAIGLPAQIQNGQFQGTILDQSGATVPNATVTATNQGTDQKFTAQTSGSGLFVIPQLPVGQYTVKVEAQGFKTVSAKDQTVNAGVVQRLDFKLTVGQRTETVEVTAVAVAVNTEDSKLANTVGATQIQNLPLNGRNVYDLIRLSPGAVDVRGVDFENGAGAVVNGVREDFNGFTINGVSNKGLSGGNVNQPIEDTVQEFQQLTLNTSTQYGNSAGSITNLVTKAGTNNYHGSLFEFVRNDIFDANQFFLNQLKGSPNQFITVNGVKIDTSKKPPLRFNQFGGTFGGPLIKDKLFFFGAYQGDRFTTSNAASAINVESPEWRAAVIAANPTSVAGVLYSNFAPNIPGSPVSDLATYLSNGNSSFSSNFIDFLCPDNMGPGTAQEIALANAIATKIGNVIGVTAAEAAACPTAITPRLGTFSRTGTPFVNQTISQFKSQAQGNLFNGNEASLRFDWNPSDRNRFFTQFNWFKTTDRFGGGLPSSARGFTNPTKTLAPNFQLSYVHTFTSKVLNEFKAGYSGSIGLIRTNIPGVPAISFDDGSMGFGSYNGYPQFFKENVYTYSDIVSINHGNHNMKVGAEVRRNIENSEFDVSRPSYYFSDPLFFAGDGSYGMAAGVDPGFVKSHANPLGPHLANLATNIRHWRNVEFGSFFQDDWKISRRLTLNLGLRYDLYKRHNEENGLATTFLKGPGTSVIDNITTGAGWLQQAGNPVLTAGGPYTTVCTPAVPSSQVLAGVCGPGGFAAAKNLGKGDHTDFGPRVGFAWDVRGNGKTSLRGSYSIAYEGTLYNPLSNSRWNPPYYSFNRAFNFLAGDVNIVNYGPQSGGPARFTGPTDPLNGQGPGGNSFGNIMGWAGTNPDLAFLTGIVLPEGIKDPYVHNYFLSLQHELMPKWVLEVDYVGTAGHKLFRAEDINRIPGGFLPLDALGNPVCVTDNFGRQLCSKRNEGGNSPGRLNPNFGRLRNWQNAVNSNYNALQTALRMQSWHGLTMNVAYTFSHSIDGGSTWHSGATTANGPGAGEGFTTDQTKPSIDRGNSIFDIRNRFVLSYVYELPWFNHSNNWFLRNVVGGWQWNGIWSYQTGAHWEPWCPSRARARFSAVTGLVTNTGCDFNLDGGRNDRPNAAASNIDASHNQWANGFFPNAPGNIVLTGNGVVPTSSFCDPVTLVCTTFQGFFTRPCAGCVGGEGRNTFVGPNLLTADLSLFKKIRITERVGLEFRTEGFNVFNRANFQLPGANGATNNRVVGFSGKGFGQAGGTFNPRQLQFGLKLSF